MMIIAYKTMDGALSSVDIAEPHNWINLVNPSKQDLETVAEKTGALLEFLEAPLALRNVLELTLKMNKH